ncbi:MAG: chromosome segregation protein SMC [Thermoplasmata archaeon]|nr:chromosome segregation protein SMC [Thermoplasmata archaeon]
MYLKEIRLENFKSFGSRVRIPFLPGFTAITGPNGSGKSNIIDAILFVLGVRSPKMVRAERLTDLIYKGNRDADYCKVSLIFDNSDGSLPGGDEIILTRKIRKAPLPNNPSNYYSYFYINGKGASLNEFVDLLSSANISENSIVQQGDVTSIVEMGGVNRRRIIDEIAGISDFDAEIEKAEREREEVERNMEHIDIILGEIKKHIRQLKKERDDAVKYKQMMEELEKNKAMLSYKKKMEIEREINEVNKQIESYEKSKTDLENELRKLKDSYNQKNLAYQEIEDKLAEIGGEELNEIKIKIDSLKEEVIKSKEKINYYNMEIASTSGEIKEMESKIKKIKNEINQYVKRLHELNYERQEKKDEIDKLKAKIEEKKKNLQHSDEIAMNLGREIAKLRKEIENEKDKLHELKLEKDRLIQRKEGMQSAFNETMENKNALETELNEINEELSSIKKDKKERKIKRENLEKNLFELKKKEAEINERIRQIDKEIIHFQREIAKLRTKEDMASYSQAVKAILEARDEGVIKGIHGSIAELGKVEEKYSKAIEVAAGRRIEAIVVENDGIAAKCIDYLKKNNYGRATFLPLNKIMVGKPRGKAMLAVRDENAVGFAIDLVKYDARYHPAFWYVFGDTVVVKNLDTARNLMGGVRLVTLDGEIIEASGAITGGSMSRKTTFGMMDRDKINDLTKRLRDANFEQEELTKKIVEIKDSIAGIEDELNKLPLLVDKNYEKLEIRKKEVESRLKSITSEFEKRKREINEINQIIDEQDKKISNVEIKIGKNSEILKEKEEKLMKMAKKEVLNEIQEIKKKLEKLQEEERDLNSKIKTTEKEKEIVLSRLNEMNESMLEEKNKVEEMKTMLENEKKKYNENKNKLMTMKEIETKITGKAKELSIERNKIYREIVELENKIDGISTKIETAIDLISRAKARIPTLEMALAEVIDIKYEFKAPLPSIEEIKHKIKRMEEKLNAMQPVNMLALEEYERQDERRKKFEEDMEKLTNQRKNLMKLEEEIKKKKKKAFYDVFNKVRENYRQIYARLAGGGDGELLLENEDNPFEGGLIIRVRPEGKRALHLNALSGGEKSIASLAFIFSIQAYNPSPFYVLDEVDMFLDEKNAGKVAKMVAENVQKAQFIVVSLRRTTLMQANHIYGVTISNGVSTVIGNVNLKEIEKVVEVK